MLANTRTQCRERADSVSPLNSTAYCSECSWEGRTGWTAQVAKQHIKTMVPRRDGYKLKASVCVSVDVEQGVSGEMGNAGRCAKVVGE